MGARLETLQQRHGKRLLLDEDVARRGLLAEHHGAERAEQDERDGARRVESSGGSEAQTKSENPIHILFPLPVFTP